MAAITATNLVTSGSGSDATSYATGTITPTAGRLILAAVSSSRGGDPAIPTFTGGGMTWEQVASQGVNGFVRITVFRALSATPGAAAPGTISFGVETQERCGWSIAEFTNVNRQGVNGANAVRQSVGNSGSAVITLAGTLSAFGHAENATYGAVVVQNVTERTISPGSGFSEIAEWDAAPGEFMSLATEFVATNDTVVDATASGTATHFGIIGVEIANVATESGGLLTAEL